MKQLRCGTALSICPPARCWVLVSLCLWGCEEPAASDEPPVLGEHRLAVATVATKAVGEECGGAGASECTTGLCLHTGLERERGWECRPMLSGEVTRVCIPPRGGNPTGDEAKRGR